MDQIEEKNGLTRDDTLVNQFLYSDFNRLPPSFTETKEDSFEYGYSFIPPKDWYPTAPYPPVCSSDKTCLVQPVFIDDSTMNLKEWTTNPRVTPPDNINTDYIKNVLNNSD